LTVFKKRIKMKKNWYQKWTWNNFIDC
jgi:hypothetical protein